MTKPDFAQWGQNRLELLYYVEESQRAAFLAEALQAAYKQGYELGLNQGWAIEQDKKISQ